MNAIGYSLRFEALRKNGRPVLTKWVRGKRSYWGERKRYYAKGDALFHGTHTWHTLRQMHPNDDLPLDPDPITGIDVILGLIDKPPEQREYPHAYIISDINRKAETVHVTPVILVPSNLMTIGSATKTGKKQKWTPIFLQEIRWNRNDLASLAAMHPYAKGIKSTQKAVGMTIALATEVLGMATGGIKKATGKLLKHGIKKLAKKKLKGRIKKIAGYLAKVVAKLDGPVSKAVAAMAFEMVKVIAKQQAIKQHFQQNTIASTSTGGYGSIVVYTKNSAGFQEAVSAGAAKFATTFVSETLSEAFSAKHKQDLLLLRRIDHTLGRDVTLDLLDNAFDQALRNWVTKMLVEDNVNMTINAINNALTNSKNASEFGVQLRQEFQKQLAKTLLQNIKTAFLLAAK